MLAHLCPFPLLATAIVCATGCAGKSRESKPMAISETGATAPIKGRPTLATPIHVGGGSVLVPFAIESAADDFGDLDRFGRAAGSAPVGSILGSDYYTFDRAQPASSSPGSTAAPGLSNGFMPYYCGVVRWHNAAFRDLATGEEWTLLDRRAVISGWWSWAVPARPRETGRPLASLIFFVTLEDTNKDGLLNAADARVAIVTDADGRNPRIVTPQNTQVRGQPEFGPEGVVYLTVVADTNGDGKFTVDDSPVPYSFNVTDRGPASPVVSEKTRLGMERLLK